MYRIAFRSCHAQSNLHRQVWPISATRAICQPQRQSLDYFRRQFHASSPKKSIVLAPIELLQLIVPLSFALPLVALLPHYLRYKLYTRVSEENAKRLHIIAPLKVVHRAVLSRRVRALSQDTTSTYVDQDQSQRIAKLGRDFHLELRSKHAAPYSVWKRQTLIPPALHFAWTAINVCFLPSVAVSQSFGIDELSRAWIDNTTLHFSGCIVLAVFFSRYISSNLFWRSFEWHYVRQMHPWLRNSYGLSSVSADQEAGTVMPLWFSYVRYDLLGKLIEATDAMIKKDDVSWKLLEKTVTHILATTFCVGVAAFASWGLSFSQVFYLIVAFGGSVARRIAIQFYEERRTQQLNRELAQWVPLNPHFRSM